MDEDYESSLQADLLDAWDDGFGSAENTELRAMILSHRMRDDEEVARFHLNAVSRVAEELFSVPSVHMILHDCYLRGWGIEQQPAKALHHLERAMAQGSERARWYLGCYLLKSDELAAVLAPDPERALDIFRDLTINAEDVTTKSLALRSAASYIINYFSISDISHSDRRLVDYYASDYQTIAALDYVPLALFYAGEAPSTDYAGPEYWKSRELLISGSKSNWEPLRDACNAQLDAWNVRPVPPPAPTTSQKVVQTVKATGMLGGLAIIMIVWTFIGAFLMLVAAAINAVTIPIIIVVVIVVTIVGLAVSLLRR